MEINPCKTCVDKLNRSGNGCNINSLNNCYADTLAAFSGSAHLSDISHNPNYHQCMKNKLQTMDRDFCNFNVKTPPVWNQAPHYFPRLVESGASPKAALKQCMAMCKHDRMYPNECKEHCMTDYWAVENMEMGGRTGKHNHKHKDDGPSYNDYMKSHPVVFWISFTLVAILLSVVLVVASGVFSAKVGKRK